MALASKSFKIRCVRQVNFTYRNPDMIIGNGLLSMTIWVTDPSYTHGQDLGVVGDEIWSDPIITNARDDVYTPPYQ